MAQTLITELGEPCYIAISAPAVPLASGLVVEQPTVSKNSLALGESFTLSAPVKNQGAGSYSQTRKMRILK